MVEKYSNIKLHEIRLVGVELFYEDGRTDMTKPTLAFRNFAKALKKSTRLIFRDRLDVIENRAKHVYL
jgi:hypothetical protein